MNTKDEIYFHDMKKLFPGDYPKAKIGTLTEYLIPTVEFVAGDAARGEQTDGQALPTAGSLRGDIPLSSTEVQ